MPPDALCFDQGGRQVRWDQATQSIVACTTDAGSTADAGTDTNTTTPATHQPFMQNGQMVIWDAAQGRLVPYTGTATSTDTPSDSPSNNSSGSNGSTLDWLANNWYWPVGALLFGNIGLFTARHFLSRRNASPNGATNGADNEVVVATNPEPVVERSIEEMARERDAALDRMIRAEIPNYESLPAEARLAISESLPQLRADILSTWRRQPLLRDGRAETDPVTSEVIRSVLESRRASHPWMAEHLPTERRDEERRRDRAR